MPKKTPVVLVEEIEPRILLVREQRVLVDSDLALLYGTTTRKLNQAVKRNLGRFPADFRFQLTEAEKDEVVTNCDHLKNLKFSPLCPQVFTEHGAIMVASVLNSPRAIDVSVFVVRAFVKLRQVLATHKELAQKISELERTVVGHDQSIRSLVVAIRQLMVPTPQPKKGRIGFGRQDEA
jgi:hypothetical protein